MQDAGCKNKESGAPQVGNGQLRDKIRDTRRAHSGMWVGRGPQNCHLTITTFQ